MSSGGAKKQNKKKQEELGGGVSGGGKNLPVTKHNRTSLNRQESVSYQSTSHEKK